MHRLHPYLGKFVPQPPADYPPGYLYVLWLIGKLSTTPGYLLLKLPSILADLGLAWIAGTFAARLAPRRSRNAGRCGRSSPRRVLFNPAVIALSAVWGQVDVGPGRCSCSRRSSSCSRAALAALRDRRVSPLRRRNLDEAPVGLRRFR